MSVLDKPRLVIIRVREIEPSKHLGGRLVVEETEAMYPKLTFPYNDLPDPLQAKLDAAETYVSSTFSIPMFLIGFGFGRYRGKPCSYFVASSRLLEENTND